MRIRNICIATTLVGIIIFAATPGRTQTTEFNYQGSLIDGGTPANGNYDFEFRLFDSLAGATQIGETIPKSGMAVSAGTFGVKLNFGSVFPGANRYLEIRVRLTGVPGFTILEPRQIINSAPYSVKSLDSTTATTATNATQLGGIAASQYVVTTDPRMSDARNPLPNSPNYIRNSTTQQSAANINISGTASIGSHGDFGGVLSTSSNLFVVGNSTLQGNLTVNGTGTAPAFNATTQFNIGGSRFLSKPGTENTFAGIGTGNVNTGAANSFFGFNAGNVNTTGANNAFFGSEAGTANTQGQVNTFLGSAAGKDNTLGSDNTFVGTAAGFTNTEGNQNTFIGRSAGRVNLTGSANAALGYRAGILSTGSANTFLGANAGPVNTTGSNNTAVGSNAGSGIVTGGNNTFIGANARAETGFDPPDNFSYATAIGADAVVQTPNTIVLGRTNGFDRVIIEGSTSLRGRVTLFGIVDLPLNLATSGTTQLCKSSAQSLALCSSSLRYKTNIATFKLGLNLIDQLKPITFDWKEGGMHDLGLGAEDVAAIEPLLVTYNNDGQVEGVKYDRIGVVLVNAVKEQQAQIDEQSREIATLKTALCTLSPQIELCAAIRK